MIAEHFAISPASFMQLTIPGETSLLAAHIKELRRPGDVDDACCRGKKGGETLPSLFSFAPPSKYLHRQCSILTCVVQQ